MNTESTQTALPSDEGEKSWQKMVDYLVRCGISFKERYADTERMAIPPAVA